MYSHGSVLLLEFILTRAVTELSGHLYIVITVSLLARIYKHIHGELLLLEARP